MYKKKKKQHIIKAASTLNGLSVNISRLNYKKEKGENAEIAFNTDFVLDEYFFISDLSYSDGKSEIILNNIKLNKNLEVDSFESLDIKTYENNIKNNDFSVKKSDKVIISGEVFDVQPLLKSLYKKNDISKISNSSFNSISGFANSL